MIRDYSGQFRSNGNGHSGTAKPVKILHIINDLSLGGAEIMLSKLLSRSNRAEFEPVVVSLNSNGPLGDRIKELGIPVECVGTKPGIASSLSLPRLVRAVRRISPD